MSNATEDRVAVVDWVNYDDNEHLDESIGGLGGWFGKGDRWEVYLSKTDPKIHPYAEAIRRRVIADNLREGGDWHQGEGMPLFSDGTVGCFSYRAWGDLMAAIWSTEEDKDYCYMDFYMSCLVREIDE